MQATHSDCSEALNKLIAYFENLTLSDVDKLSEHYSAEARFKDPFNEVTGLDAIASVFTHMFSTLHEPRFIITKRIVQGDECFLIWDFLFRFKRFNSESLQTVRGCTHIIFSPNGLVQLHRDYWDAAEELYEKIPLIGKLMRWLKSQANS